MGRGGCGGMRQGQRGRDTGGRGCGGREQRDSKVTRVGAACVGVGATQGWGRTRGSVHLGLSWNRPWHSKCASGLLPWKKGASGRLVPPAACGVPPGYIELLHSPDKQPLFTLPETVPAPFSETVHGTRLNRFRG